MNIVLATQSKYKKRLFDNLGVPYLAVDPQVDEGQFKEEISDPLELCECLAAEKARAVAQNHPDAIVIGTDQLVAFEGNILGKAGSLENSLQQLKMLKGKTHQLYTSACVIDPKSKSEMGHTDITTLKMRDLNTSTLERYVNTTRPTDCAGSYKLEEGGTVLFEQIHSNDHTAIIGLPLIGLTNILLQLGVQDSLFSRK